MGPKRPRSAKAPTARTTLEGGRIRWLIGSNSSKDLRDNGEHALVNSEHQGWDAG